MLVVVLGRCNRCRVYHLWSSCHAHSCSKSWRSAIPLPDGMSKVRMVVKRNVHFSKAWSHICQWTSLDTVAFRNNEGVPFRRELRDRLFAKRRPVLGELLLPCAPIAFWLSFPSLIELVCEAVVRWIRCVGKALELIQCFNMKEFRMIS
jgi:hypothetical protein